MKWFFLLYLLLISYMIAGAICAYVLWRFRNQNGNSKMVTLLSYVMGGIFLNGFLQLCANNFGYEVWPRFSSGFAWCYWAGQACQFFTLWRFTLHMLTASSQLSSSLTGSTNDSLGAFKE